MQLGIKKAIISAACSEENSIISAGNINYKNVKNLPGNLPGVAAPDLRSKSNVAIRLGGPVDP